METVSMGEYRDLETKARWFVGNGWCVNQDNGQAIRGNSTAIHPCVYLRSVEVPATELEGCDLGLNARERHAYNRLRAEGKTVLRAGWPDLLVIDGDEVYGVEVKSPSDRVTERQQAMHDALGRAGIRVDVVRG